MGGSQQAARAVSIRAEVEWVIGGKHDRRDVLDAGNVPFESVDVVRTPSSWKHKRNYEGYYWAATTGSHVWFESLYERAALMRLDRDRRVVGLAAQPMWIHWSGGLGKHAPDFFVRYRGGGAAVVDVKPAQEIDEDDAEVFSRTAELCELLGWDYAVISDISSTEHRNLRFLSGYRFERWISAPAGHCPGPCRNEMRATAIRPIRNTSPHAKPSAWRRWQVLFDAKPCEMRTTVERVDSANHRRRGSNMRNEFSMLEFMCADALVVGTFWSELLEVPLDDGATSAYAQFSPPDPQAKWLFVQSEPNGGSDRMLVALTSDDLDADADRAVSLGARSEGRQENDGFEWVDMRDPEGNRFTFNAPPPR